MKHQLAIAFDAVLIGGMIVFAIAIAPLVLAASGVIVAFDRVVRAILRRTGNDEERRLFS